ncbi:MAG: sigma-54 dependent transcriptional regulator [Candidatus Binatia bacterium]|nr:sigma-54 dependent transcriptional regulator [Candidatus Binatia bacterium]
MSGLVLLVEDDRAIRVLPQRWLEDSGYTVEALDTGEDCLQAVGKCLPDAILLDVNLPGVSGLDVLAAIKDSQHFLPVIMMTSESAVETVVSAMQLGAYDYLVKPLDRTKLVTTLKNAVEKHRMSVRLAQLENGANGVAGMVGSSPVMKSLFARIARVGASDVTVLVNGESGTGKELAARAIHEQSRRSTGPFVALNCAAIPETLQEDELFGHEKGAFTGADQQRAGKFELADRGTLFLDEIGELSPTVQAKLLRAVQERTFQRVGGTREITSNFRLLGATNRDLRAEVAAGNFREDLFYRIAVFELQLPPLRDRREDIPGLALKFLRDFGFASGDRRVGFSGEAMEALMDYAWPGNVRELQNAVQRSAVECVTGTITPAELSPEIRGTNSLLEEANAMANGNGHSLLTAQSPLMRLDELERLAIENALKHTNGNVSAVVRHLGIGRTTLYRKLKKYGLQ